jgi:hypothetical protein
MKTNCIGLALAGCTLVTSFLGTSCSKKDTDERQLLVVSVAPQRYILDQLAGDRFRIVTLMPNGENPEVFEPSVEDRRAVARSRMFFTTGFFPFEADAALSKGADTEVINTSAGINLLYGTHSHESEHTTFLHSDSAHLTPDPHVWTSLRNSRVMAANIASALRMIDPDNSEIYSANERRFDRRLDSLDRVFSSRLDSIPTRSFMVWHPSLSYFARDYGLEQLAVSADSKETSMRRMRAIIDEARRDSIRVFFYQRDFDSRQVEAINSGVGSRMVAIQPNGYDCVAELSQIVDDLAGE